MVWISIILGIIEAIPTLLKLIQQIIDAIHGHPAQVMHEHAFLGVIRAWHDHKDPVKLEADLRALHSTLQAP